MLLAAEVLLSVGGCMGSTCFPDVLAGGTGKQKFPQGSAISMGTTTLLQILLNAAFHPDRVAQKRNGFDCRR